MSLARIHRTNREAFFNMLEKVATKNNLSDTLGNIFNIFESFIKQITDLTL